MLKVACGVDIFEWDFLYILLLFDKLAYTKCILPESSFDMEQFNHYKKTLLAGCKRKTCIVFSNGVPIYNYGPSDHINVEKISIRRKRYPSFFKFLLRSNFMNISFCILSKMRKMVFLNCSILCLWNEVEIKEPVILSLWNTLSYTYTKF